MNVEAVTETRAGRKPARAVHLQVPAMSCRRCVRTVTARLRDVPGVATIEADAQTRSLVLAGTMTVADVVAALEECGYPGTVLP